MDADLNNHHRDTIEKIFSHPASGNVEWRHVRSLLEAIGTTVEDHDGKVKVTLGPETEVLHPPHSKDIDRQMMIDLRRMLKNAGFGPGGTPAVRDERIRDRGDGRWGEPS